MVKKSKTMLVFFRVLFFSLFLNSLLFSGFTSLNKAIVQNHELNLFFSNNFQKSDIHHFTLSNPHREIFDIKNTRLAHSKVPLGLGKYVRLGQNKANTVRIVIQGNSSYKAVGYQPIFSNGEYHISLPKKSKGYLKPIKYVQAKKNKVNIVTKPRSVTKARPVIKLNPVSKPKPIIKPKPVYRAPSGHKNQLIVIDAGHGGHDSGAVGGGKKEKDLVLRIAKKTAQQLKNLGYSVYMTRNSNRFLKLKQRTHIADKKGSVAFISIHANAVPKKIRHKVHGVETFFLQNTRDEKSQSIAARENASVLKGTGKLSKKVIVDSVLNGPKIVQSNKLAIDVQRRIMTNLHRHYKGVKDGGVRHAPFYVLVGASRPSVLVEVGYISNPRERKRLFTSRYQNLIAKGIAEGVSNYLNNRKKEIDF
jgi:N-acetylmuramoyl-L-alanine amidase